MIFLIATFLLIFAAFYSLLRPKHPIDKLPGPSAWPLVGNALELGGSRDQTFDTIVSLPLKYGPLFRLWLGSKGTVSLIEPSDIELVLSSSVHISKSFLYEMVAEWLGEGLLISTGSKWHSRRKMLTPAFHFKILNQFMPVFTEKTKILVEKLGEHVGETIDIVPFVTRCALDIICETAMGTNINCQEIGHSNYADSIYELNNLVAERIMKPWVYSRFVYGLTAKGKRTYELIKDVQGFTNKIIAERREQRKRSYSVDDDETFCRKKTAFLDLLLDVAEKDPSFSDKDIREEVDTFMFEGHDTTSNAISWTLLFLGWYPEIQEQCVAEITKIFDGSERPPSQTDLADMKLLERVIKESLRLRPIVPLFSRKLTNPLTLRGHKLPPDTIVRIHAYNVHRIPEIWPEPDRFDPDRFLPENSAGRHPYAYIPFSAGPRNCIGQKYAMQEMKMVLSSVLRHFRLASVDPELHYNAIWPDIIMRAKVGIPMKLYRRN